MTFIQVIKTLQKYFSWNYLIVLFAQFLKLYSPELSVVNPKTSKYNKFYTQHIVLAKETIPLITAADQM